PGRTASGLWRKLASSETGRYRESVRVNIYRLDDFGPGSREDRTRQPGDRARSVAAGGNRTRRKNGEESAGRAASRQGIDLPQRDIGAGKRFAAGERRSQGIV